MVKSVSSIHLSAVSEPDIAAKLPLEIKAAIFEKIHKEVDGTCLGLTCKAFYEAYRYHYDDGVYGSHKVDLKKLNDDGRPLRELIIGLFPFHEGWWFFTGGRKYGAMFIPTERLRVILLVEAEAREVGCATIYLKPYIQQAEVLPRRSQRGHPFILVP